MNGKSCLHSQRWQRTHEEVVKTCAEHQARLEREELPKGVQFKKSSGSYAVCITTRFGTMKKRTSSWDFAFALLQKFKRTTAEARLVFGGSRTKEEIKHAVAKNYAMVASGEGLPDGIVWLDGRSSSGAKQMWKATLHVCGFGLCSQNLAIYEWVERHIKLVDDHNAAYRLQHANDTEDESDEDAPCYVVAESDESDDDSGGSIQESELMVNNRPKRSSTLVRRVYVEPGDDPLADAIAEAAAASAAVAGESSNEAIVLDDDDDDDDDQLSIVAEVVDESPSESSSSPPPPPPPPPPPLSTCTTK